MTLPTKYSNGSIARSSAALAFLGVVLLLLGGGCASSRHAGGARPTPLHGYADLDALVRSHPGWAGVARYDETLARLAEAAAHKPAGATGDLSLATLSPAESGPTQTPTPDLAAERARLTIVEATQVARLQQRQSESLSRQIALDRAAWQRPGHQADLDYQKAVRNAQAAYARRAAALAADDEARRLNLTIQIAALRKIVGGWKDSVPPTPRLNQARLDLAQKQAQLAALRGAADQSYAQARSALAAMLAQARRERDAFIAAQAAHEEARLRALDERQVAAYRRLLSGQRTALLHEEQSPPAVTVAPVGSLSAQSLPPEAQAVTVTAGAARSLREAQDRLRAQRLRWLTYLYDDTRAAALDEAGRRHWVVTFGPPAAGETDLTAALAGALRSRVWKT